MLLFRNVKYGFLIVILIGAAIGAADEMIQIASAYRHPMIRDVLLDVSGTGTGAAIVIIWKALGRKSQAE